MILFSLSSAIFSQELSNKTFDFLNKNGFSPVTQSLVAGGGENSFPYNVISKIPSSDSDENKEDSKIVNLILIFNQEDFFEDFNARANDSAGEKSENEIASESENSFYAKNRNMIKNAINQIKSKNYEFNVYFLFAYGEKQKPEKQGMIYGSQVFLEYLNSNEDSTAIIFGLNERENKIIANNKGTVSASWLIRNEFNVLANNNFQKAAPRFYLSQLSRLSFFENKTLAPFFENEIPAVKIDFCAALPDSKTDINILNVILQSAEKFSQTPQRIWEQHFFTIKIFGKYFNLSEKSAVKIIILIVFVWISFLTFLVFVNQNKKKYDWRRLKKIWHVVPVTFLLILFSFWSGRRIFSLFSASFTDAGKVFGLFCAQFSLAFVLISVFYEILLHINPHFEEYSVDFLITFCCFINQSLFILIDISLFPIFMFICLLSILALFFKNNALHVGIFVVMILPFLLYFGLIIKQADFSLLRPFCFSSGKVLPFFTLILYPVFIVYFRILTSLKRKIQKKSTRVTVVSVIFGAIVILILISTFVCVNYAEKRIIRDNQPYYLKASEKNSIRVSYEDKKVFDDTIRTLEIQLEDFPLQCNVSIQSQKNAPILYSDNDFARTSANSVYFKIPSSPPRNLKFVYCSGEESCVIVVTAIFDSGQKNVFNLMTKSVKIESAEK